MIPKERAHLRVAADSHTGMRHSNNEDNFSVGAYSVSATDATPSVFAIIADGIGGHQAGEVASEIATEMISQAIAESDASQPATIMQAAILQASNAIRTQSEADPDKSGMGTTTICAWVIGNRLYSASVGNSRLYLIRDGRMHQLNIDHTWVQEAVEAGILSKEQAREHPNSNIIRRYVGSGKPVDVDIRLRQNPGDSNAQAEKGQGMLLQPGDRLLLCSDGLHDLVADDVIQQIILENDLDDAVQALIAEANENGGKDNITVVLLQVPATKRKTTDRKAVVGISLLGVILLSFIGLLLVAGLGFAAYRYFTPTKTSTPTPTTLPTNTLPPTVTFTLTAPPTLTQTPTLTPSPRPSQTNTLPPSRTLSPTTDNASAPGNLTGTGTTTPGSGAATSTPTP
ncbi:MAG: serine/threonine-protein phosphatase [Anaerolineales bacterium]|nr:serine/threonine-protein phosphatase [Anaerolineales bacterium]